MCFELAGLKDLQSFGKQLFNLFETKIFDRGVRHTEGACQSICIDIRVLDSVDQIKRGIDICFLPRFQNALENFVSLFHDKNDFLVIFNCLLHKFNVFGI